MKSKRPIALLLQGGGADRENVRYCSGFDAPDPFYVICKGDEVHVLVSPLELGRAQALSPRIQAHNSLDLGLKGAKRGQAAHQISALLKRLGIRKVQVSSDFPVGVYRALEKLEQPLQVAKGALFPQRIVKSESERSLLRISQKGAVSAMKRARQVLSEAEILSDGLLRWEGELLSSEGLRLQIDLELMSHGLRADEVIVAGGDQACDPHERGFGPLRSGEAIILDIFPRSLSSGYWGDLTRTVVKGKASSELQRLYRSVKDAQEEALGRLKPGVTGAEIHQRIVERFDADGWKTQFDGKPTGFIHSTGHGVGLEIHEAPSVSPKGGALEEGMVITVEPGLYYPGLGGIRVEDTVEITADGAQPLARCSKSFRIS